MKYMSRKERRVAIVDAAVGLVWEKGLGAATVRAVAEALQASPGQIHHHFGSADELRAEAFREAWRRMTPALMHDLETLKPLARLAVLIAGPKNEQHVLIQRLWRDALASARMDESVRKAVREELLHWQNVIASALAEANAQGDLSQSLNEDHAAHRMLALCLGLDAFDEVVGSDGVNFDREVIVREAIEREMGFQFEEM
ncbi:TetR family transcriptional regulator [Rhodobacterales bacterium]|nr:TetR family transcriptional regulator [Rhodobacterales bacterium]